ncbi:hypothetical protein BLNAU_7841 [Blattamonas nauphoetae]|uniref:PUM-HD domain-containing protein n=1 Tax=Blattamonas nauphoetae TaxID=2049346 RepID=A0ABQ9Y0I1_9EUKA|nr:hypothetical protein BLNAU_7841 [Blattamonas nauphoetae]
MSYSAKAPDMTRSSLDHTVDFFDRDQPDINHRQTITSFPLTSSLLPDLPYGTPLSDVLFTPFDNFPDNDLDHNAGLVSTNRIRSSTIAFPSDTSSIQLQPETGDNAPTVRSHTSLSVFDNPADISADYFSLSDSVHRTMTSDVHSSFSDPQEGGRLSFNDPFAASDFISIDDSNSRNFDDYDFTRPRFNSAAILPSSLRASSTHIRGLSSVDFASPGTAGHTPSSVHDLDRDNSDIFHELSGFPSASSNVNHSRMSSLRPFDTVFDFQTMTPESNLSEHNLYSADIIPERREGNDIGISTAQTDNTVYSLSSERRSRSSPQTSVQTTISPSASRTNIHATTSSVESLQANSPLPKYEPRLALPVQGHSTTTPTTTNSTNYLLQNPTVPQGNNLLYQPPHLDGWQSLVTSAAKPQFQPTMIDPQSFNTSDYRPISNQGITLPMNTVNSVTVSNNLVSHAQQNFAPITFHPVVTQPQNHQSKTQKIITFTPANASTMIVPPRNQLIVHPPATNEKQNRYNSLRTRNDIDPHNPATSLRSIYGQLRQLLSTQEGCRFFQSVLDQMKPRQTDNSALNRQRESQFEDDIGQCVVELSPYIVDLSTDQFGNYATQRLFQHATVDQRRIMLSALNPLSFNRLCCDKHGLRFVQRVVNLSADQPALRQHIMGLVLPYLTSIASDAVGIHALHSLLSSFPVQDTLPVAEQLVFMSPVPGSDEHGHPFYPMLQRIVRGCRGREAQKIVENSIPQIAVLSKHPNANYLVKELISMDWSGINPSLHTAFAMSFLPHLSSLMTHHVSSSVLCLLLSTSASLQSQYSFLSSFLSSLASCSAQFPQFMTNESCLLVFAALAKVASQPHLAQLRSMFRPALKRADDFGVDGGQRGWNVRDPARMRREEFTRLLFSSEPVLRVSE